MFRALLPQIKAASTAEPASKVHIRKKKFFFFFLLTSSEEFKGGHVLLHQTGYGRCFVELDCEGTRPRKTKVNPSKQQWTPFF